MTRCHPTLTPPKYLVTAGINQGRAWAGLFRLPNSSGLVSFHVERSSTAGELVGISTLNTSDSVVIISDITPLGMVAR